MADFQIPDKTLLTSVDRATDSLLIYDADALALKRSTVNNLLDLTSHPVGINDSQILTLKTLTAPTISSPVLSGTVTGTYTLGGTPTFPSSVVTLTGSQTLTNKVLTSPTINTATISNPTLTVDTVSEFTSANGVTIDGLNIKDSKLNTNNSVVTANITNSAVTAVKTSFGGNYTTSEVDTGFTWVDGKTIYKKTINFGALPNATSKTVAHSITNLDFILSFDAMSESGTTWFPIPFVSTAALSSGIAISFDATNVTIAPGSDRTAFTSTFITLYYVKT